MLFFVLFSCYGFSQSEDIVSNTNEFDYLIGMEYSEVSELKELDYKTRTGWRNDEVEMTSTNFIKGGNQIMTSETVRIDATSNSKVYKIHDIIVLNGFYASCEGCLLSNNKGITIKSFHPIGRKKKDSILLAFEKNNATGKFKPVDPSRYTWNGQIDLLERL